MKKVKIVKGVYGHRMNNIIVPKSSKDAPFDVSDEIAERLIQKGVAILSEKVNPQTPLAQSQDQTSDQSQGQEPDQDQTIIYDDKTKLPELKQIAIDLGVDEATVNACKSKASVIELIESVRNADGPTFDENDVID